MTTRWTTTTLAIAILTGAAAAAVAAPSHRVELDDRFSLADVTGLAVSPDGAAVAWTERRWQPPAEQPMVDLWAMDLADTGSRRLTFDACTAASPRFGPDGRWIYYGCEDTDGVTQVLRVSRDGGVVQPVTRADGGVSQWALAGDGHTLVYVVDADNAPDEWEALRQRFPGLEYGRGKATHSALRVLDLTTWRSREVPGPAWVVLELDVDHDGRTAALVTAPDTAAVYREGWSSVQLVDLATGEISEVTAAGWRREHPSPFGWVDRVRLADDGGALTFTVSFDGYPTRLYVAERGGGGWRLAELPRPEGVSVVGGSSGWRPGSRDLLFTGDVRARVRLFEIPAVRLGGPPPAARALTRDDVVVDDWAGGGPDGSLVVAAGTPAAPADLYRVTDDGALAALTRLNPQLDDWLLPSLELVRWRAPDGREVEGLLETPPGWTPAAGPLPTIVQIHGGPTSATHYERSFRIYGHTLLAARGYAVLSPNYRGSTGYGDDFMTELVGHENRIDVADILAGVDALVARGIADPARLGVMGWSNGGFLTNALVAAAGPRFKAASSGAGVLDQVIQWATEDTPGHVVNFMGGALPWEDPQQYVASSPLYGLGDAATPTLIHVGGADPRVPPAHSRGLYRALTVYLGVPSELVIYPGAEHGLKTYSHQRAKMSWDLAWFERYLGPGWTAGGGG